MNYSDFLLPCLLLAILQQIILVAVCTSLASEKAKLNIYKNAGLNFSSIFFGKSILYILIGSIINFFNIFIILPINSIHTVSLFGVFTVSTAFIVAMVFFSILISSLFRSPEVAMAALMFYSLPTVLLSGFACPHNAMPVFLKAVSYFFSINIFHELCKNVYPWRYFNKVCHKPYDKFKSFCFGMFLDSIPN
jgi:ABC-2 type transport system permease protein